MKPRDDFVAGEGPHEDEEFGDEVEHTRKAEAGESSEAEDTAALGICLASTTKSRDVAGASFVVNVADDAEEEAHHKAVCDHLADCTGKAHEVEGRYTEEDVTHVAHAGITDEELHVFLYHGDKRTIDDIDHAKQADDWCPELCPFWGRS